MGSKDVQTSEKKSRTIRKSNPKRGGYREGAGRPKGVPNKLTADVKSMILGALSDVGGQKYLARQAEENPGPFLTLLGKVLPMQVTGAGGGPVEVREVRIKFVDPE